MEKGSAGNFKWMVPRFTTNLLITNFLHYKATNQMEDLLLDGNDEAIANNTIDIEMHENEIQDIKVAV